MRGDPQNGGSAGTRHLRRVARMAVMVPPGEQGKDQCFACFGGNVEGIAVADGHALAAAPETLHQGCVVSSTPRHDQLQGANARPFPEAIQVLGYQCRRESGQGGDHILRAAGAQLLQPPLEIVLAKALPAR